VTAADHYDIKRIRHWLNIDHFGSRILVPRSSAFHKPLHCWRLSPT
jgi:hypothetical protein